MRDHENHSLARHCHVVRCVEKGHHHWAHHPPVRGYGSSPWKEPLKYSKLAAECQEAGWKAKVYPVEVGRRRFVSRAVVLLLRGSGRSVQNCRKQWRTMKNRQRKPATGFGSGGRRLVGGQHPYKGSCRGWRGDGTDIGGKTSVNSGSQLTTLQLT